MRLITPNDLLACYDEQHFSEISLSNVATARLVPWLAMRSYTLLALTVSGCFRALSSVSSFLFIQGLLMKARQTLGLLPICVWSKNNCFIYSHLL